MSATANKIIAGKWGCGRCTAGGSSTNAVVVAARHSKTKGHPTWAEETRSFGFGGAAAASSSQRSML